MHGYGPKIVGNKTWLRISDPGVPQDLRGRFPLLLKFLDAAKDLSVQVHPNDLLAARLDPPDLGKTEAWYVMDAMPGATVYAGLKSGVNCQEFSTAVATGKTGDLLHSFQPKRGDCIFIPAGTVHAIGSGLLILEIQQASNTTWRIFDWDRVDKDGKGRELHIERAIGAIDFLSGPMNPCEPVTNAGGWDQLVVCEYFNLSRKRLEADQSVKLGGDGRMHIVAVTEGNFNLVAKDCTQSLGRGSSRLIPASANQMVFESGTDSELIDISDG